MTSHPPANDRPRVAVVTCAVLELEVEHYRRQSDCIVSVVTMQQGLHNEPDRLRRELQVAIDAVEAEGRADVIVLGYGLCSRGIEGVTAKRCRLVVPRAHDCITVLLGSKERYAEYVAEHPGTYWYSPGWNKHHTPPGPERHAKLRAKYVQAYGEDNADFLMESEQAWFTEYKRATYVHLSVGATDTDKNYTRGCADWLKWRYDEQTGDPSLLIALLKGEWDDERFVVLEPGQTVGVTADARVMEAVESNHGPAH